MVQCCSVLCGINFEELSKRWAHGDCFHTSAQQWSLRALWQFDTSFWRATCLFWRSKSGAWGKHQHCNGMAWLYYLCCLWWWKDVLPHVYISTFFSNHAYIGYFHLQEFWLDRDVVGFSSTLQHLGSHVPLSAVHQITFCVPSMLTLIKWKLPYRDLLRWKWVPNWSCKCNKAASYPRTFIVLWMDTTYVTILLQLALRWWIGLTMEWWTGWFVFFWGWVDDFQKAKDLETADLLNRMPTPQVVRILVEAYQNSEYAMASKLRIQEILQTVRNVYYLEELYVIKDLGF